MCVCSKRSVDCKAVASRTGGPQRHWGGVWDWFCPPYPLSVIRNCDFIVVKVNFFVGVTTLPFRWVTFHEFFFSRVHWQVLLPSTSWGTISSRVNAAIFSTSCARREFFVPNCDIFLVLNIFKCNRGKANDKYYFSIISIQWHHTDEFKKKATNYCIRFGHSLWSAN